METIKKWIDESDIYMLILGGRYGTIEKGSKISYTESEYKYALENNIPIFAIVIDGDELNNRVGTAPKASDVKEVNNIKQYNKFKECVLSNICGFFKDKKDIKIEVFRQIHDIQIKAISEEIEKINNENNELRYKVNKLTKIEYCNDEKKDECKEKLGNIYSKENMGKKYNDFLKDSNEVYILVGDLDFLLEPMGKEQLNVIKELGKKCNILFRKKDIFSDEVINLCKELLSVGVNMKYYSGDVMDNIKNIKGQFKINQQKHIESLITCKKSDKFRLINFENQYLSEIFMNEVKILFSEKSKEVSL